MNRHPKQVYTWLKGYGIPTRERGWRTGPSADRPYHHEDRPYHHEEWLRAEYVDKGRSAGEIAQQFDVTDANILFFMRRFGIPRRTTGESRALKHWGTAGPANGMFGRSGPDVPSWKGGVTPERAVLYCSLEWAEAVKAVWRRDRGTCQRCGVKANDGHPFAIHHLVSFAVPELRTALSNLLLLCVSCHRWVHSRGNTERLFIQEWPRKEVQP